MEHDKSTVASRTVIWPLVEQMRVLLVPLFHGLHRRPLCPDVERPLSGRGDRQLWARPIRAFFLLAAQT
jgi:hypothetical protein